jgi:TonB family protein
MKKILITVLLAASAAFADANVEPARIIKRTAPDTRAISSAIHTNGTVALEVTVNEQGRIGAVRVVKARPDLLAVAINTIHQWDFAAATVDGHPVRSLLNVDLNFAFHN